MGKFLLKSLQSLFLGTFLILAFASWNTAFGQATVTTDKLDYAPGEYVIITGTGWEPGERVDFTFVETPKPATCVNSHDNFDFADENGDIYYDGFLIKENHLGVHFVLTATGQSSGRLAVTEFTDANSTLSSPSPTTAAYGSIITVSSTLTQSGSNTGPCTGGCVGNGNAIPGKTVNFSLNGGNPNNPNNDGLTLGSGVTDASGVASASITISLPVGNYNGQPGMRARFSGDVSNDPYAGSHNTVNFSITKAVTSFSSVSGTGIYGGSVTLTATSNLNVAGISVSFSLDGVSVGSSNTNASGVATLVVPFSSIPSLVKNAGTHTNKVSVNIANTTNYSAANAIGNLIISTRPITVSANAGQSKIYGNADPVFAYTPSEALLPGNSFSGALGRTSGETVAGGPYPYTIGNLSAGSNYSVTLTGSNTFAITKADQTITVTTASPASAVYNTGFTVAANASSGLPVAYTSSAPLSNVGADYTMNSGIGTGVVKYNQAGDDNYNAAPEVTANVAAAKAESTIVATGITTFTYTGSAQGPGTSDVTGSTGAVTYSYTGTSNGGAPYGPSATKPTLAGSYSVVATVAADDNFNGKSSDGYGFSIDKAESTIVATGITTFTYTGSAQGPGTSDVTGSTGVVTYSYTGTSNGGASYGPSATKPTLAGSYSVVATVAADDNYNGKSSDGYGFSIDKAESTIVATGAISYTYNAAAQGPGTSTVTGSTGVVTYSYTGTSNAGASYGPSATKPTLAGTYSVVATVAADDNYNGKSSDGYDFTIDKADAVIVVNAYDVTYDANPHTSTGTATGVSSEALAGLDLSGTTHTNAGDYTGDSWTFTDVTGNYNDDAGTVDNNIDKADAVIVVNAYDVTYDANPHTSTGTATGVSSEALAGLDLSGTTHTNAGDYTGDSWTFTDVTGNYNDDAGTVDNNIDKADAVIVVNAYDVTYDANPHTSTGTATGVSSEALAGLDLSGTTHTNAGDYTGDSWTFTDVTGNYNDDAGTVDNNIDKADAVIVVNAYDVTYDANPHTSTGTATGVSSEALAGLDLSGTTHTNAGDYTGDSWTFTDVTGNYNDDAGTVDNNIDKADAVIVVNAYDVTYDANPHTSTGTATGVSSEALAGLDLSGTTHTNAGDYTGDSWTFTDVTGNYNDDAGTVDNNIDKADAVIVVNAYDVTYDANPHTSTGTATGVSSEALAGLDLSGTTHTNAGDYTGDSWTFTDVTGNYNDDAGTVDNNIDKADAVIVVNAYDVTYDANPHTSTGTATGVSSEALAGLDLSGTTHTNAGDYTGDSWTFTDVTGNYNDDAGTVDNNIDKADAVIVVNAYDVTYDANPHTSTGTATGVSSEALAGLDLSGTTHTNAGDYTGDSWTFTDVTGNYNDDNGTVDNNIDKASTSITVLNSLADCQGDDVTLTAIVSSSTQLEVNGTGGIVTFKNGSTTIGTVTAESVTGGIFSDTFPISLPLGAIYSISAEYVPYSGNLTGSQTTNSAQLTVMKATISSSIPKNANGNVVIFDGAASSLGLPSSTTLTTTYQPSPYSGLSYQWYERNEGGSFTKISSAVNSTYQVVANGDFVKEYKVELIVNEQCVGNEIFSKVISVEASCGKAGQDKVQVCHVMPNGKRNNICVSANAVNALLAGSPGSFIGNCNVTYRMEEEPELISVPWNTPLEVINDKIVSQSENWFDSKKIKLTINAESYNPLAAGFYEMKVDVQENEWFDLEEPISVNVLVADKPLATDIRLSNSIILRSIQSGSVIGDLSTIDPVDNQHTYTIAEQSDFELVGKSLIWKGLAIPASTSIRVFSTDRAGQTIERVIELSREPRFGDFNMFPNPAQSDVNLEVELDQTATVGIRIFDAVGRLVHEQEGVQSGSISYQIAIDNLSPGLYTVQVKTGQIVMNKRLIKK